MILALDPNAIAVTGFRKILECTFSNLGQRIDLDYIVRQPYDTAGSERVILFDAPDVHEYAKNLDDPVIASKEDIRTIARLASALMPDLPYMNRIVHASAKGKSHSYWISSDHYTAQPLCIYSETLPYEFSDEPGNRCGYCSFAETLFGQRSIDVNSVHDAGISYVVMAQGIAVMRGLDLTVDTLGESTERFVRKFGKGIHWPTKGEGINQGKLFTDSYTGGRKLKVNYEMRDPQMRLF